MRTEDGVTQRNGSLFPSTQSSLFIPQSFLSRRPAISDLLPALKNSLQHTSFVLFIF